MRAMRRVKGQVKKEGFDLGPPGDDDLISNSG